MAKKLVGSAMSFWLVYVILVVALLVVAGFVVKLQNDNNLQQPPDSSKKNKSVSRGMTEFYAAYRMSSTKPFEEDIGDFVVQLNTLSSPLDERLEDMESIQKPISRRWVGEYKYRSFKAGTTVREAITDFAEKEGMQLLWELDKDFIIKNQFQIQDTISGSLSSIANAIDGSFEQEVKAYLCPKQRSLVITEQRSKYLQRECSRLKV